MVYYDCTNNASEKYAPGKQYQPSYPAQTLLYTDYSGIPLAICLRSTNENEQQILTPLEEMIMQDSESVKFVVFTDEGPSGEVKYRFSNSGENSFVTSVSVEAMDKDLQDWCLDPEGWHLEGSSRTFNLNKLGETDDTNKYYNKIFYKETKTEGYDAEKDSKFSKTLVVTFSFKYKNYLRNKRSEQAWDAISFPDEGRAASEEQYDGFYAVETSLDSVHDILRIIRVRRETEEFFRIKNDYIVNSVHADRSERIKAHFLTSYIALLVLRILENKLGTDRFSKDEIISALRDMQLIRAKDTGYMPSYTRSGLTDALHKISGFDTDYEIIRTKAINGIISKSKKR